MNLLGRADHPEVALVLPTAVHLQHRQLRRLCVAIGLGSLMEGKMTTDILMLTLRENVGLASGMINNYLAVLGVVTFISGRYLVRLLLSVLGPRRFTDVSLGLSVAGHTLMGRSGVLSRTGRGRWSVHRYVAVD